MNEITTVGPDLAKRVVSQIAIGDGNKTLHRIGGTAKHQERVGLRCPTKSGATSVTNRTIGQMLPSWNV